jgi:hypothetical protein
VQLATGVAVDDRLDFGSEETRVETNAVATSASEIIRRLVSDYLTKVKKGGK